MPAITSVNSLCAGDCALTKPDAETDPDLGRYPAFADNSDAKYRVLVRQQMQHRQQDPDFACVRGDALAKLPEVERREWQKLWEDVEALRKRAAEKN